jgi:hypothetical protein
MNTVAVAQTPKPEWMKAAEWLRRHPGILGKDAFYARLREGNIPCPKVGRTVLVPDNLLERMMAEAGKRDE